MDEDSPPHDVNAFLDSNPPPPKYPAYIDADPLSPTWHPNRDMPSPPRCPFIDDEATTTSDEEDEVDSDGYESEDPLPDYSDLLTKKEELSFATIESGNRRECPKCPYLIFNRQCQACGYDIDEGDVMPIIPDNITQGDDVFLD